MSPRISPLNDAMQHVLSKTDKTSKIEVKYINTVKGRGVFAKHSICKGEFVVEYRGERITEEESERRRRVYHPACAAFMFAFKWRSKTWCIDASIEDGSLGRLVNDEHRHPNCRMKQIDVAGHPHLCLFALNDIEEGEEITYDYGGSDCPWRTQPSTSTNVETEAQDSKPLHSGSKRDDGPEGDDSSKQPSTSTNVVTEAQDSKPLHTGSKRDDGPEGDDSSKQPSTSTNVETEAQDSKPLHSGSKRDDGPEGDDSSKQPSTSTNVETEAQDSKPLHSGSKRDDGPEGDDSSKQPSTSTNVVTEAQDSKPLHTGSKRDDGPEGDDSSKQPSTSTNVETEAQDSKPLHSGSKRDDGPDGDDSSKQPSTSRYVVTEAQDSKPLHSGSKRDDGPDGDDSSKQLSTSPNVETEAQDSSPLHSGSKRDDGPDGDDSSKQNPSRVLQTSREDPTTCQDDDDDDYDRAVDNGNSPSIEPSAEEIFHPAETNEMIPPPSRKRKPPPLSSSEEEMPVEVSTSRSSSKGRAPLRRPWSPEEVQAVERHLNRFITSCIVPGKYDCERCLKAESDALRNRTWQNVKFYVHNRITSKKKKTATALF